MNWPALVLAALRNKEVREVARNAVRALHARKALDIPEDVLTAGVPLHKVEPGGYYLLLLPQKYSAKDREAMESKINTNLGIRVSVVDGVVP